MRSGADHLECSSWLPLYGYTCQAEITSLFVLMGTRGSEQEATCPIPQRPKP